MKSIFKVLMIALLGFAFTGNSQTDPTDNPNSVEITDDYSTTLAIDAPVLVEVFTVSAQDAEMQVKRYLINDCEYLSFAKIDNSTKQKSLATNDPPDRKGKKLVIYLEPERPDLFKQLQPIRNSNQSLIINRRARDGISQLSV